MSATCTAAIPGLDGRCTGCSRPTAVYDGRTLHKRGRWREGGQAAATMRLARQANLARRAEERERGRAVAARRARFACRASRIVAAACPPSRHRPRLCRVRPS